MLKGLGKSTVGVCTLGSCVNDGEAQAHNSMVSKEANSTAHHEFKKGPSQIFQEMPKLSPTACWTLPSTGREHCFHTEDTRVSNEAQGTVSQDSRMTGVVQYLSFFADKDSVGLRFMFQTSLPPLVITCHPA